MKFDATLPRLSIIVAILLAVSMQSAEAQVLKKTMGWIVHHSLIDTTDPGQSSFRIYPTLAYSPETKLEIGFSTLYLFQAKKDTNNRISEINAFSFFTMQSQYGIWPGKHFRPFSLVDDDWQTGGKKPF